MAESFADRMIDAATRVGQAVSEKVEEGVDRTDEGARQVGETGPSGGIADIRAHMDVIGSDGNVLGRVDHLDGDSIKLTRDDSLDGRHHLIPTSWVTRVDRHVHISKDCGDARREWDVA